MTFQRGCPWCAPAPRPANAPRHQRRCNNGNFERSPSTSTKAWLSRSDIASAKMRRAAVTLEGGCAKRTLRAITGCLVPVSRGRAGATASARALHPSCAPHLPRQVPSTRPRDACQRVSQTAHGAEAPASPPPIGGSSTRPWPCLQRARYASKASRWAQAADTKPWRWGWGYD